MLRNGFALWDVALGVGGVGACLFLLLSNFFGLYQLPALLKPHMYIYRIFMAGFISSLLLISTLFLMHIGSDVSRAYMIYFEMFGVTFALSARFFYGWILNGLLDRGALLGRLAILIGQEQELKALGPTNLLMQFGFKEIARVLVEAPAHPEAASDVSARVAAAIRLARERGAEELVVAIGWNSSKLLEEVSEGLRASALPVRLLPDRVITSVLGRRARSVSGPMISVELQRAPLSRLERALKRGFDVALACLALLALWPTFVLAAIAIKLDTQGPVLFRQQRTGFDGDVFTIYKFRTMTTLEDGPEIVQARPGDARITRVGSFLRSTSIDELPQFLNVLRGDMSLVGPRPHAVAHDEQYQRLISKYSFRFHVKPGLTGWAQVNGLRGETARLADMQRRIQFDLWYINNWSFGLDVWILARTAIEVLRRRAY
jgi:undecaprenyl-phosphate galactose phosphotransferase/putative colanic acid biosynthesis UDP-glucose lipid carrier transferase